MAPKRPAPTADDSISASDASDAEPDSATNPDLISPSPTKTPTPPPNSTSDPANSTQTPLADPDDVELGSDSAASDSEADHDASTHTPNPKPTLSPPKADPKPSSPLSYSDNPEPESDNDHPYSDSDHHDAPPPPPPPQRPSRADASAIKPISSRPMDNTIVAANTGGVSGSSSRPAWPTTEPRAKRPRSNTVAATPVSEKRPQRLWSPEDELAILHGLVAYRAKHGGTLPASSHDIATLYTRIRGALSVKVSTTQLSDKVRRLKQKYQLLATKAKNGKEPEFAVPHDKSIYDIAKKVWAAGYESNNNVGGGAESDEEESGESDEDMESGRDYDNDNNNKSNVGSRDRKGRRIRAIMVANGGGGGSRNVEAEEKGKEMFPYLWEAVEELAKEQPNGSVFKRAFEVLERSKARAMEEKLRRFRMVEIRQQLRRMELMRETVRVVLEALEREN